MFPPEMDTPDRTADRQPRTDGETARLETLAANAIRGLTIDAVEQANSGHPGLPMGMADAATVLWSRFLRFNPKDPHWADRDRFVLSGGHGSMLLYSLLHLSGYDLPLDELKNFRQLGSKTPGHPEVHHTPGVETTTGPLGQGIATAVGMALAERTLAAQFNTDDHTVVDHYTYVVASDGDLQEGVSNEACSFAGHQGLGKLVVLYDDNYIQIDGSTDLAFTEDRAGRYEALGWHVIREVDGHDNEAVADAIATARDVLDRPSLIACRTTIGFGSPHHAGTHDIHSDALGAEEIEATKKNLDLPLEPFAIPEGAETLFREQAFHGSELHCDWEGAMTAYAEAHPEKAAELTRRLAGDLPDGWADALPSFAPDAKGMASRAASGKVLDALAPVLPELVGGSADLTPSNKTKAVGMENMQPTSAADRYVHYGVREHGMAAIMNGLVLHGGVRPYGGTFLIFSDYGKAAIRLGALMKAPVVHVFTHDSVGLGEDGPTHQPIEQLAGLRAIPGLHVIRPADANETAAAWKVALETTDAPTALALSRQNLPTMAETADAAIEGVARGAYVLSDADGEPEVILIATGSEVGLAMEAKGQLGGGARVVSMPCERLFFAQDAAYQESVLPDAVRARVAVEAGSTFGWGHVVGLDGEVVGLDRFGESAPGTAAYEALGLTVEAVVEAARRVMG